MFHCLVGVLPVSGGGGGGFVPGSAVDDQRLVDNGQSRLEAAGGPPTLPSRYRHPGDLIRLITSGVVLVVTLVTVALLPSRMLGARATLFTGLDPDSAGGEPLIGLVQLAAVAAVVGVVVALLRRGRFRLLLTLAGGAVAAGLAMAALEQLLAAGQRVPDELAANLGRDALLGDAGFPGPVLLAAAMAVAVVVGPWLTHSWRRAVWIALGLSALVRVVTGTVLPAEVVLAFATGAVVGSGLLVAFGAPDRRMGPRQVAAALAGAGLAVESVSIGTATGKGARPFLATTPDGRRLFVKSLGRDERDADLLYRAYRFVRLRRLGDARPAASLGQAVEHQALVGLMAEQAGVRVAHVDRVARGSDGSALLAMDLIDGRSLDQVAEAEVSGEMLHDLWTDVDRLHRAGIAHRSLRTANVMVGGDESPRLIDFSFSELAATDRQVALDVAELLASLAVTVGPERSVTSAAEVIGPAGVASAVPLLQPLALSAATRRTVAGHDDLLGRTRGAAAEVSGEPPDQLARVQRVRPRTLLMIAVLTGAFYFLLPQLAQVSGAWKAFKSAELAYLPLVIGLSALTYVGSAVGLMGAVPQRLALGPTTLAQVASSFVNRVTPASIGGMVLNTRFLQKSGVEPATAIAGVGLNSVAGGIVHILMLVAFFTWSKNALGGAFKLPSGSTALVVVTVAFALMGAVLVTRWGRRKVMRPVITGVRSSASNLRKVAKSPVKLTLLFGGSILTTLAYVGAFAAAVAAFGVDVPLAEIGAVYLGGSAIAAAAPTPGGLGALEAALVAGLTGVGVEAGAAVSIVLTYRLATYWLPVLPGWAAWSIIQRRGYV
jgi:undecaprenyl-diphosphatase